MPDVLDVTDDDATIAEALEAANVPAILATLVHLTGDTAVLRPEFRPHADKLRDRDAGLGPEARRALLSIAAEVIASYREDPRPLPPPFDRATVASVVAFTAGGDIGPDYVEMMAGELGLTGDAYGIDWHDGVPDAAADFRVLVIGAGMSGLCAAIRLGQSGIDYLVVDKNDTVGGTWLENRYPGCRVDVANHFYSYSFTSGNVWPEHYSQRGELHAYFETCADRFGVRPRIRFRTEVVSARWDEPLRRWHVMLRDADGAEEVLEVNAVISAVGQLNRPKRPDLEGIDEFEGPVFHSARWPEDFDVSGKRVALVGTGASALQIAPAIADSVRELTIYQRSAPWAAPNPDYQRPVGAGERWLFATLPFYEQWYRFALFWRTSDQLWSNLVADPEWPFPERSMNASNDAQRAFMTAYIESALEGRPDLIAKAVPDYPPMGKRFLIDGGWFAALRRDDVELVTEPIDRVISTGIRTADGVDRAADVIVFATGFETHNFLWPMDITGRGGKSLAETWGDDDARAFLGLTVPDFPNLFCLYGPNTNLGHGGSIIFNTECQVRYTLRCLRDLLESGLTAMDVRRDVHDRYNERVDAQHACMIWTHPGMRTWYRNAKGRVTTNWPWPIVDYWKATIEPNLDDYDLLATAEQMAGLTDNAT